MIGLNGICSSGYFAVNLFNNIARYFFSKKKKKNSSSKRGLRNRRKRSWKWKRVRDVEESDLHIALEDIERSDGHVSGTSAETTADCTGGKEGRRVHLDLARLARCRNDEVPGRRRDAVVGACCWWRSSTEHGSVKTKGFV